MDADPRPLHESTRSEHDLTIGTSSVRLVILFPQDLKSRTQSGSWSVSFFLYLCPSDLIPALHLSVYPFGVFALRDASSPDRTVYLRIDIKPQSLNINQIINTLVPNKQ